MATLSQIRRFEEGADLLGNVQQDVKDIESGNCTSIEQGWNDLGICITKETEFSDLFSDPYSISKGFISKTMGAAETYLQALTLQIAQPNSPGNYINLYVGTNSMDDGDINQNFQDEQYDPYGDPTGPSAATLWEILSNPSSQLINDSGDAQWDTCYGKQWRQGGLATNWGDSGNFSWFDQADDSGDGVMWSSAQGSLAQWSPYIHLEGQSNDDSLNSDAYLV